MDAMVSLDGGGGSPLQPKRYALHLREGPGGGLIWRYRDEGITLTPLGLAWTADGQKRETRFAFIDSIRLQIGHIPKSGQFGSCTIGFWNGRTLIVNSLDSRGLPDSERAAAYADFLQDLHARLGEDDRRRIRFLAGNTEGRHAFGWFAAIVGGAFFVLLPLVLAIVTGEIKALLVTLTGFAFVYPVWRMLGRNRPRSYNPRHLEDAVFPHL